MSDLSSNSMLGYTISISAVELRILLFVEGCIGLVVLGGTSWGSPESRVLGASEVGGSCQLRQLGHVLPSTILRPPLSEVISSPALAFREEVAAFDEFPETELERAGLAAGELDDLAEGEGFVIGEKGDDSPGERRNSSSKAPFG